ncbi:MAG: peptidase E [Actinobacteria bacterium]|nr:peptidase E [Actinomycetota bacterium]
MPDRQIIALGGGGDTPDQSALLWSYVLDVVGKGRPRMLYVPTAIGDSESGIVSFYDRFARRVEASHLLTFPYPPDDLRGLILSQDAICVSGGNTANMLAIWQVHGIDLLLREAWESGILLWGASAGMICWFEAGVTDSFGPRLAGLDCLGFLPGSACPHYDGEELRRPRYHELVAGGFPEGIAADDGVAVRYSGPEIAEIVSCRPGAAAYRVTREGEQELESRSLG